MVDGLERLLDGFSDQRFYYDTTVAEERIDFMENCIKLTKSPFYGKPMILMLWQKAFIEAIYSFKMTEDDTDRFRRVLLLISRKNTKSEMCSGLGFAELILGQPGSDIVCSSNDDMQANILYEAINTMRLMVDPKQQDTWKNQQHIRCKLNDSKIFKLSDRTRNKEGRNIDFGIVDECYTGETEVLTDRGFVRFDELTGSEKVAQWNDYKIEFVKPVRFIQRPADKIVINNLGHGRELRTTENHNIVYEHNGEIKTRPAADCWTTGNIPQHGEHVGGKNTKLSNLDRMIIATQADGSLHYKQSEKRAWNRSKVNGGTMFLISLSKERKIRRFEEISKEGFCVSRLKDHGNKKRWTYVLPTAEAKKLYECFSLDEMTAGYAADFINEVIRWDGYKGKTYFYYSSTDKKNADFVAAVAVLAGFTVTCSIEKDNRKETYKDVHRVYMRRSKSQLNCATFQKGKRTIDFDNLVYCVEVPAHKIAIRSNGVVLVCGNCHEMKDNVIIKSIEQSQSLKPNPKLIMITTEGFVNQGFLDEELIRARDILSGADTSLSADRYLPWLYTQDSEHEVWTDPNSWVKSNPTLGHIKRWDYLREQVDAARKSNADRAFVLSKDFNFKVSDSEAWLMSEQLENTGKFDIFSFHGNMVLGGVDLAETTDMCSAKVIFMNADDPTKYVLSMYWIPEGKLERSPDTEGGARYTEWAKQGLIRITEGNEVDVKLVADWFMELHKDYGFRPFMVGYDQRFSKEFLKRMDEYGIECERINQNRFTLSAPMRLVEADLISGLINFNENPIDKWCLQNTSVKVWDTGHIMPVKIKGMPSRRIDGTASLINAYEIYRRYKSEFSNSLR